MTKQIISSHKIVVVGDDEMELDIFRRVLKQSHLDNELSGLLSGAACLEYLHLVEIGQEPMPALLLIDVRMPGNCSGRKRVAFCRSWRRFRRLKQIT